MLKARPIPLPVGTEVMTRFWDKVHKTEKCWHWCGAVGSNRFGIFKYEGSAYRAHRFAYAVEKGSDVPADIFVRQACGNRLCVNPEHMELIRGNR